MIVCVCVCVHIHKSKEQNKRRGGGAAAAASESLLLFHSPPTHALRRTNHPASSHPLCVIPALCCLSRLTPHRVVDTHTLLRRCFASPRLDCLNAVQFSLSPTSFRFLCTHILRLLLLCSPALSLSQQLHIYLLFYRCDCRFFAFLCHFS